jgi:CDGSH-type Zn-finger protein/uncharacterized Fe-S cluster protein YjdI
MQEPTLTNFRIETREQLFYTLTEAAEIEHNLMCCYLYAAFSMKDDADGLSLEQADAVARWRKAIVSVAVEEMSHLALVANLMTSIGGAAHFGRPSFPIAPGYHPAGVQVRLAPFDAATLQHFVYLERPSGSLEIDGAGFAVPSDYVRSLGAHNRLMPSAHDYETVGHLYHAIAAGLTTLAERHGERGLFAGDPSAQVGPDVVGLPGLVPVVDLRSALAAVETIVMQGEGASLDVETGHYQRFVRIRTEYQAMLAADPSFVPARPVARNPVMRRPPDARDKVFIEAPAAAAALDLANGLYGQMLRLLYQGFGRPGGAQAQRPFLDAAIDLMYAIVPVAEHLTTLPARGDDASCNAGITFSTLRPLAVLPYGASERRVLEQRFDELTRGADGLRSGSDRMNRAADAVARTASAFAATHALEASQAVVALPASGASEAEAPESPGAAEGVVPGERTVPDQAEGSDLTLSFDTQRCIHARFCVTGAPATFLANVEGPWLHPDRTPLPLLIEVAHACPSGAITYRRKDGGANESAPMVNLLSVRENGPYAVRAPISVDGKADGYRATLCRCGASSKKPYCDGSHTRVGFIASGEPARQSDEMLRVRDGALDIRPQTDGPLRISGPLEIISGTGRVVSRATSAVLCRCGGSATKPFCDGTHKRIGFRSEAAPS